MTNPFKRLLARLCAWVFAALLASPVAFAQEEESFTETDDYYGLASDEPPVEQSGFSFGLKAGTNGLGLTANFKAGGHFFASLGGNYLRFDRDFSVVVDDENLDASIDISMIAIEGKGYLYPFNNFPLYLAGGVAWQLENRFEGISTIGRSIEIGDAVTLSPEDTGLIGASVEYQSFAPYAGIGIGRAIARGNNRLSAMFEAGVYYFGEPEVEIIATKLLSETASQQPVLQQNLQNYKYYPMLSLAFNYRL